MIERRGICDDDVEHEGGKANQRLDSLIGDEMDSGIARTAEPAHCRIDACSRD